MGLNNTIHDRLEFLLARMDNPENPDRWKYDQTSDTKLSDPPNNYAEVAGLTASINGKAGFDDLLKKTVGGLSPNSKMKDVVKKIFEARNKKNSTIELYTKERRQALEPFMKKGVARLGELPQSQITGSTKLYEVLSSGKMEELRDEVYDEFLKFFVRDLKVRGFGSSFGGAINHVLRAMRS